MRMSIHTASVFGEDHPGPQSYRRAPLARFGARQLTPASATGVVFVISVPPGPSEFMTLGTQYHKKTDVADVAEQFGVHGSSAIVTALTASAYCTSIAPGSQPQCHSQLDAHRRHPWRPPEPVASGSSFSVSHAEKRRRHELALKPSRRRTRSAEPTDSRWMHRSVATHVY